MGGLEHRTVSRELLVSSERGAEVREGAEPVLEAELQHGRSSAGSGDQYARASLLQKERGAGGGRRQARLAPSDLPPPDPRPGDPERVSGRRPKQQPGLPPAADGAGLAALAVGASSAVEARGRRLGPGLAGEAPWSAVVWALAPRPRASGKEVKPVSWKPCFVFGSVF